jgi:hypothetical protein
VPAVEIVAVVLLTDLVSATVHWAEDSYGSETTPILGRWIVAPITGALNPALDALGWWRQLERLLEPQLGTARSTRRSSARFH